MVSSVPKQENRCVIVALWIINFPKDVHFPQIQNNFVLFCFETILLAAFYD